MWGRKISCVTIIFYVNRYGTFIFQMFLVFETINWQGQNPGKEVQDMLVILQPLEIFSDLDLTVAVPG